MAFLQPTKCRGPRDCVFCAIIEGTSPATFVYQDENYVAFNDIKPASEFHLQVIPRTHIKNVESLTLETVHIVSDLLAIGEQLVKEKGGNIDECRMGFHWPPFTSVDHLHLHVIFPERKMSLIGRQKYRRDSFFFVSPNETIKWIKKNRRTSSLSSL